MEQTIDKGTPPQKKYCFFCKEKKVPSYTDVASLKRYTNDRGKINPKQRSGVCSKHQRVLSKEIKHARHLGLLPFTLKV